MADDTETPKNTDTAKEAASSLGIADGLRNAFADYVHEHDIKPDGGDVNVDLDFIKNHGGPLVTHMLRAVTNAIVPKDLKLSVPAKADPDAKEGEAGAKDVNVNFDVGDFLKKLLTPPSTPKDQR